MSEVQKNGHVEVVVDADVWDVWRVVSDVTRIGEWSHECRSADWLGGANAPVPGARFRGRNRAGWVRWNRSAVLTVVDEPHEIAWRTVPTWLYPDSTEWRIRLDAVTAGTLITQSFTVVRTPARVLDQLYASLLPAHQDRATRQAEDLERLGAAARRGSHT